MPFLFEKTGFCLARFRQKRTYFDNNQRAKVGEEVLKLGKGKRKYEKI